MKSHAARPAALRTTRLETLEERTLLSIGAADTDELLSVLSLPEVWSGAYDKEQGLWIDFNAADGLDPGAAAKIDLTVASDQGIAGQISIPGAWLGEVTLGNREFARLTIPESGCTEAIGKPELPVLRSLLTVPKDAEVTAQVDGRAQWVSMMDVGMDQPLAPVQAPVPKMAGALEAAPLDLDPMAYEAAPATVEAGVRLVESGELAGQRLVMLEVTPFAYDPVAEAVGVFDTLTFSVSFQGGQTTATVLSASENARLEGISVNYQAGKNVVSAKTGGRLLVIVHNDFQGDIASYVTHKTGIGWTVDVANTSTAGATNTAIRSYIQSRYANVATRPDAVLLVGDTDRIPHFVGSGEGNPVTDLYYGCMDSGDDWYPEIPVGRFSVTNATELGNVIAKTIWYETSSSGPWTNHATFMASQDNYQITEGTHDYVIDTYMDPLGYTSDRLYQVTHGATTQDTRNSFNTGTALGVYSGHGSETSWADGPPFSQSDVRSLTNAGMYPLVFSFACVTGSFQVGECFMETWLRQADKAAVVAVGSSVNSYWTEDDILERVLFDAIYDEGYVGIGDAWVHARELYLAHFGSGSTTRRYFEMYNIMGDPTVVVLGLDFAITSPTDLPMAFVGEPYAYTLQANSGTEPYGWELIAGSLPAGLSLDPVTGTISGTPVVLGTGTFTIEATDAESATDSREFHLPVVSRFAITMPGELPTGFLDQPYSVTLAGQGGTQPYSWTLLGAGEYLETDPGSGYLGGGTPMGWHADDNSWLLSLPFSFPYYGAEYDSVYVCSNGFLDFASGTADYTNTQSELANNARIAVLWDDLYTGNADEDIYVTQTADHVVVRWDASTLGPGTPVDAEVVLFSDGRIQFSYGQAHSALSPTIGVSAGDGTHYTMSHRDSATSIPANQYSLFSYGSVLPEGMVFDAAGQISGMPTEAGTFEFSVLATDSGTPQQGDVRDFTLEIVELPPLLLELPDAATEGDGLLVGAGIVRVFTPVSTDLTVRLQSEDGSEVTVPATATIRAGHTSATFDLQIEDDTLLDGTQAAMITASADGYFGTAGAIAVHDNESAVLTVSVPEEASEGDGVLLRAGTVTVGTAPDSDVTVSLASDDVAVVDVPATVVIRAGTTAATFDVVVIDDAMIDDTQTATITAHVENWTDGSDTIAVLNDDGWIGVLLPPKIWESQGTLAGAGTVTLGGTLTSDLVVSLVSDDTSELTVPSVVIVPAGQASATFDLTVEDDADQDGKQLVHVSATAPDLVGGSGTTSVGDDEIHHFAFDPIGDPQTASVPFAVTLSAKDVNDETIEVYGGEVDLIGDGDSGPVAVEINPGTGTGERGTASEAASDKNKTAAVLPSGDAKVSLGVYHDYATLGADLAEYATLYPAITRLVSIGQSVQGRELWAMKITDNPDIEENEPEVKYVSTMHGDEPVGTEMCMYFIDMLLDNYGSDPRITALVDETEIWIVPLMNPDGREAETRGNANGVDLNRAFPDGAVTPIGNIFDGPPMDTVGLQPEVTAVMEWSADQSFVLSANFHTGALLVNYPYDNDGLGSIDSPTPDDALFEYISEAYSVHNTPMWNSTEFHHGISNGAAWYSMTGGMQDWNYRYLGCNEVTIELSDVFWPAESSLLGFWTDNQESMLSYFETAHMGVRGLVTDATTGDPLFASITVAGNSQPVFSDADVGDYHRMLLPGTYDLTFSIPGYASRTFHDVVVGDATATSLDVALAPLSSGILFIDGVWTGEVAVHTVDTNVVLTAADGLGHAGSSNAFDVAAGPVDRFQVSSVASPQSAHVPTPVTVTAVDAHGHTVTDFVGPVNLGGWVGSGTTSTIVISEVNPHSDDSAEFINVSGQSIDISGWQMVIYDADNWPAPKFTVTVSANTICAAGEAFVVGENGTLPGAYPQFWTGGNIFWDSDSEGAVLLLDATGQPVDFVCVNGAEASSIIDPIAIGADQWQGPPVAVAASPNTYERFGDTDHNDQRDWRSAANTIGSLNPGLSIPFGGGAIPVAVTPTVTGDFVDGVWVGEVTILEEVAAMYLMADDGTGHVGVTNLFDVELLPLLVIDLSSSATEGDDFVIGAVDIPAPLATDLVVTLQADDSSEVTFLSPTVTIRAGDTYATFDLLIEDDVILDGTQIVTVTASADGYRDGTTVIAVNDNESATLTVALPASASEGDGILTGQGIVSIGAAAGSDVVVSLTSHDTTEVTVPATVTIPAGADSVVFDLTIEDDSLIDGVQATTIAAYVENWTDGAGVIDVEDNDAFLSVLLPALVWEGGGTLAGAGTATIGGTLETDLEVALVSDTPDELTVPEMVIIPAGQTSVAFDLIIHDDADFDGSQPVVITVTASGLTDGSESMEVGDDEVHHFAVDTINSPQTAGEPIGVMIWAEDVNGATILVHAGTAGLSAVGAGGPIPVVPATTEAFVGGVWTGNVVLSTVDTGVVLTAEDTLGHAGSSNAFDLVPGEVDHFVFSTITSPQNVDVPFSVTLTAVDAHGYTATGFNGTVALSGRTDNPKDVGEILLWESNDQYRFTSALNGLGLAYQTFFGWDDFSAAVGAASPTDDLVIVSEAGSAPSSWDSLIDFVSAGGRAVVEFWDLDQVPQLATALGATVTQDMFTPEPLYNWGTSSLFAGLASPIGFAETGWNDDGDRLQPTAGNLAAAGFVVGPTTGQTALVLGNSGMTLLHGFLLDNVTDVADAIQLATNEIQLLVQSGSTAVAISPAAVVPTDGVWTGDVTVLAEAADMYLLANDGSGHLGQSNRFDAELLPRLVVDVPQNAVEGDGLVQGTVSIPEPLEADLVVTLVSEDETEAMLPSLTTIITAGETSATFDVQVMDDALLDGTQVARIVASAVMYRDGTGGLVVHDNETAPLVVILPDGLAEGDGLLTEIGLVTVGVAPDEDVVVTLISQDVSEIIVPNVVIIPAGAVSARFDVTVVDDTEIDGVQTVVVSAQVENWTDGLDATDVADNEGLDLVVTLPSEAWEGQAALPGVATVSISGTLPADLVVSLQSDDLSELQVPPIVTIPAGATSATFDLVLPDDPDYDGSQTATVTASAAGLNDGTAAMEVADSDVHHFAFDTVASPQRAGATFGVTIHARNIDDRTILVYDEAVSLSGSGDAGAVALSPTTASPFTDGMWTGGVAVETLATGLVLTADDGLGHIGASNAFDVVAGPVDHFVFGPISSPQYLDVPVPVTIVAQDAHGFTAADFTGTVNLRASSGAGEGEYFEIDPGPQYIGGGTSMGWHADDASWLLTLPFSFPFYGVEYNSVYVCSNGFLDFASNYADYTNSQAELISNVRIAAVWDDLYTGGAGEDIYVTQTADFVAVRWDASTLGYGTPVDTEVVLFRDGRILVNYGQTHTNLSPTIGISAGDGVNYLLSSFNGASSIAANVSREYSSANVLIAPDVSGTFVAGVWSGEIMMLDTATSAYLMASDGGGHHGQSNTFDVQPDRPPSAEVIDVVPDPRNAPVGEIMIVFDEEVVGFDLSDLALNLNDAANVDTIGSATDSWVGGGLGRLNAYEVSTTTALSEIEIYLDVTASTTIEFVVYEAGPTSSDPYQQVFATTLVDCGTGQRFYSSGPIHVALEAGRTYMIGAAWEGDVTYYRGSANDVSFGTSLGFVRYSEYPSPETLDPPLGASVAYYYRLTTPQDIPLVPGEQTLQTADNVHFTLGGLAGLTATAGNYRLRLAAAGSGIEDMGGNPLAADAEETWVMAVTEVAGRYVFYNDSAFDDNDPAANASDDDAIASDKEALLPGQTATFANYTSYSLGLNGLMIDVRGLANAAGLDAADFRFRVGNSDDPGTWDTAPDPVSVSVRAGEGVEGSDRVTIIWASGEIRGQWLQVTMLPGEDSGLAEADVFYFGNAVGEAGNSTTNAQVNATDMLLARNNPRTFLNPAAIDFPYDYNRDARVNATDMLLARNNQTHFLNALKLITVPAKGAAAIGEKILARDRMLWQPPGRQAAVGENARDRLSLLYEFEWMEMQRRSNDNGTGEEAVIDNVMAFWP
ncbi:MAG: putative Ig domain-containing protein [Pirellulales bacterium]|nr:putative Ig domain-containing protein [Pirellulales bacterium]